MKPKVLIRCSTCRIEVQAVSLAVGLRALLDHRGHQAEVVVY